MKPADRHQKYAALALVSPLVDGPATPWARGSDHQLTKKVSQKRLAESCRHMSLKLPNRRKRTDPLLRLLTWLNALAVVCLLAALCLTAIAKPELETFFDRYYEIPVRQTWNRDLLGYIGPLLGVSLLSSLSGLFVNRQRLRRKGDYIHATLVICLLLSLVGVGLFARKFW